MLVLSREFAQSLVREFCATFVAVFEAATLRKHSFQVSTSKYFSATNRITPLTNHVRSDSFRGFNTLDMQTFARFLRL